MMESSETLVDELARFYDRRQREIKRMGESEELLDVSRRFMIDTAPLGYTYHFDWMGRPIIQFPQDIVALQELVWRTKPDLVIETGIAHGGSLILTASLLALQDLCDCALNGTNLDPSKPTRRVIGIDIDIREHNRALIQRHPLSPRIRLIQGSSVDSDVVSQVAAEAAKAKRVMVCLDSNHTHAHVLSELKFYAPLVTEGCYCIVWDTAIEDVPKSLFSDRQWGPGNNPKTAVWEFLKTHPEFEIDRDIQSKLLITVAPDGYLRRK